MKNICIAILSCLFLQAHAQAPQGIPYQCIVRNSTGTIISNQAVSIRFSIHDSSATGNIVYQESHSGTTTPGGMLNLTIGQGTAAIGTFSNINWGNGSKFLQVELDAAGGNNYIDLGTQQMMSVPYALYSNSAGEVKSKGSNPQTLIYTSDGF
jgi:hypothetical protein